MALAPSHLGRIHEQAGPFCLTEFDRAWAPLIASWVTDPKELFWLAPKTMPPLTAEKVLEWPRPDGRPCLFWHEQQREPAGYAELNPMPGQPFHLWIGHCMIRPEQRGLGWGHMIVDLLVQEAFAHRRASGISLVVFPENAPAVRCYRACGFLHVREQVRYMPVTGRHYCMVEMRITRKDYEQA